MEDYIQFSAKQRMKLSQKRVLSLELPVTSLIFRLSVRRQLRIFGIGSKPAVIKVRKNQASF